jgi:hypothetical protein
MKSVGDITSKTLPIIMSNPFGSVRRARYCAFWLPIRLRMPGQAATQFRFFATTRAEIFFIFTGNTT